MIPWTELNFWNKRFYAQRDYMQAGDNNANLAQTFSEGSTLLFYG